jgi:hypothetical protein
MSSKLRALESEERKRSHAYPVLDLGAACDLLIGRLHRLGDQKLDREGVAAILGYTSAAGGAAARKIGALVQFGFLDRHAGVYELSQRGHLLQNLEVDTPEYSSKVREALERPVLFRRILDRYRPSGQVPDDLARVLSREFGITARASEDAAIIFFRSARFARMLNPDGSFREDSLSQMTEPVSSRPSRETGEQEAPPPMTYPLAHGKEAQMVFPPGMAEQDLLTLMDRLRFDIEHDKIRQFLGLEKPSGGRVLGGTFKNGSGKKTS